MYNVFFFYRIYWTLFSSPFTSLALYLHSTLCTHPTLYNDNCCTVSLLAFSMWRVWVFPGGGSRSVAFRGLNTRAVFCLCVLGMQGKWCGVRRVGVSWSPVPMHIFFFHSWILKARINKPLISDQLSYIFRPAEECFPLSVLLNQILV